MHNTRVIRPTPNVFSTAVLAMICAALIAGCGTSSDPTAEGQTGGPALAYAQCVRAHGVPNFPDPGAGGLIIPNDINPQSPAFMTAQRVCDKLPQAGPAHGASSASRELQLLTLARCMRSHGVPEFADPTSSPPPPSTGNAVGGNGWYLALGTARQRQSPAYRRAAAACGGAGIP
jgi:hypothetical protein